MGFYHQPSEVFTIHHEGVDHHFDVSFLLSHYQCSWGAGCKSINLSNPSHGCCTEGAIYLHSGDEAVVDAMVASLPDDAFTNAKEIRRRYTSSVGSNRKTRVLNGMCIFHNQPSHPNGEGCALHQAAVHNGTSILESKPRICSWVPLNIVSIDEDDDGNTTDLYYGRFENEQWGGGEAVLDWWCLDDPDNFHGQDPVFRRMAVELEDMIGVQEVYQQLVEYLRYRDFTEHAFHPPVSVTIRRKPQAQ